ncbi:MAG: hypothetical protein R3F30_15760 [Planctomycetota bacterium]
MGTLRNTQLDSRRDRLLALAEGWASATKDLSIYPETNHRVRDGIARFLAALQPHLTEGDEVELTVHAEKVRVAGEEVPFPPTGALPWLRRKLDAFGWAGVAFGSAVDAEGLLAFTRLINARRRGAAEPEHPQLPGIRPIPRVFSQTPEGWTDFDSLPEDPVLVEILAGTPDLGRRIELLQRKVDECDPDDRIEVTPELMAKLIKLLPIEELEAELDVLGGEDLSLLLQSLVDAPVQELELHGTWAHLLDRIGTTFFGREAPAQEDAAEPLSAASRGHPGDDLVDEDVGRFLEEFDALPEGEVVLASSDQERLQELVGTWLCQLVLDQDPAVQERLAVHLDPVLRKPDPAVRRVVERYLDPDLTPLWQVGQLMGWLRDHGHLALARSCGAIRWEDCVARFPVGFLAFLDALDPGSETDRTDLAKLCQELGAERISAAAQFLARTGGLSQGRRADLVLGHPRVEQLPLVALLLDERGTAVRDRVVTALRSMSWKAPEACLLRLLPTSDRYELDYLRALCLPDAHGRYPATLRGYVIHRLRDLAESEDDPAVDLATRIQAVRLLGRLRAGEARSLLQDLARKKGFLGLGGGDRKQLAEAAKEALRALET